MRHFPERTFWVEAILASVTAFLGILTLVWPDWIEKVFGADPDQHSGSFEWTLVALCFIAAILFSALARRTWQKAQVASA